MEERLARIEDLIGLITQSVLGTVDIDEKLKEKKEKEKNK